VLRDAGMYCVPSCSIGRLTAASPSARHKLATNLQPCLALPQQQQTSFPTTR
jgi:hypothetical protein